ncbi:MAG: SUMF1/EgtB/PvdO family nonheme iron enzyme, partial [Pseudomonadota bacterium]
KYIICCDTGRRSESAGFLLSHKGFDVYVLEGGIPGRSIDTVEPVAQGDEAPDDFAKVIDFDEGKRLSERQSGADSNDVTTHQRADEVELALAELRTENESLTEQLQSYHSSEERLAGQLEQLRGELGESGEKLSTLYAQAKVDAEQLELLRGELGEAGEKLRARYAKDNDATDEKQLLQEQYHTLQEEFSERGRAYEQEIGQLREQLKDELEPLEHEMGETAAKLEEKTRQVASLREELSLASSQASEDKSAFEEELKSLLDKSNEKIERLEVKKVEFKQKQSVQADELETLKSEHAQLQQQLVDSTEQNKHLEGEVESLKQQTGSLVSASDERLQKLQAQLEEMQENTGNIEQLVGEKEVQIGSLQEQLAQQGAGHETLHNEHELLQQQLKDLHLKLEQQEERAKVLEQENEESVRKAHEDLTRKNDNEKELQGQIDRLRKKLEQQTIDHKKARKGARDDTDNLREQLHAERQDRAEERAEMAARQRELKEQLSVIATEHESNLSNQSGTIEQARDAARQEEQERLQEILAAQAETEDLVIKLQQELKKAHEEIAELSREAKDRRQVDVELMEEQNQQAAATISQLESQLKQLTEERDVALDDQQSLCDKINTLRGEVEVARGLAGESSELEDSAQLRKELDENKKNAEIALRLRAEAEAARDQLLQERDALQQQDSGEVPSEPLYVPSLDGGEAGPGHPGPQQHIQEAVLPADRPGWEQENEPQPLVDGKRDDRQRRWLGTTIGLGLVVGCALAGWLLIGVDFPVVGNDEPQRLSVDTVPDAKPVPAASNESPTVAEQQAKQQAEPVSPDSEPVMVQAPPSEESQVQPPKEDAVGVSQRTPVIAGRSFNDGLKAGGQGPVMVELPADSFEMGSAGKSLNFDEGPRHRVKVPAFSIGKYEVTLSEYDRFARATGRRLPKDESWGRGDHPAINVSWSDARAYARWLSGQTGKNYRLPSEAEWEYATRAGSEASFWWYGDSDNPHANCFNCGSEWDSISTTIVGSFAANAFGLHDVSGNVQEWTADCYHGSYKNAPVDGSAWVFPECDMRVVRGGAYTSPLDTLRSAKRSQYNQDTRLDNLGFRVVREN